MGYGIWDMGYLPGKKDYGLLVSAHQVGVHRGV